MSLHGAWPTTELPDLSSIFCQFSLRIISLLQLIECHQLTKRIAVPCFSMNEWINEWIRPCLHSQLYRTRISFANNTRRVGRIHTASTAPDSSGTLRSHQEVFSVDVNGTRRVGAAVWMLEWMRRVRQRRAVCACLQTDLFLSTPLIYNAANRARRNHGTVGKSDTPTN